jgi:hypothetical protein
MGRTPIRAKLVLDAEARSKLEVIAKSRTEGQDRIERARVLLAYHAGERVTALAEAFQTNRPKIERILNRALEMGALASLEDRPGRGRKPEIRVRVHAQARILAEPGGSLFRQDDQDHPQGDPGGLEGWAGGSDHALPPGPECRPGLIPVALQA